MSLFERKKSKYADNNEVNLLHSSPYKVIPPAIPSGEVYYFTTDSGIEYEVRIGKIKDSLARVINFNVMNDEYADNEYAVTNRGELYRVVATVIIILRMYMGHHPYIRSYEFTGEFKEENNARETSIRTMFFCRALQRALPEWNVTVEKNKGRISK